jgi:hypothetical protein
MIIISIKYTERGVAGRRSGGVLGWRGGAAEAISSPVFTRTIEKMGSFLARAKASKKISPLFFLVAGDAILT